MDSAHLTTNRVILSPFHLRLALSSGSILPYLPPHDRFLSILTILTKHQAWAPVSPMLLLRKARFVRVEFCFSPSAKASQETKICKMWWNHLRIFEIHKKEISMPSTAFFSYFRSYSHIMWSPMKWKEQAQIHLDLHDGLGTSQHQCSVWPPFHSVHNFTFDWLCLDPYCSTSPPHGWFFRILTNLTKHQAWAPAGPMSLCHKLRFVRAELCFSPSANAWQQTKICKLRGDIM